MNRTSSIYRFQKGSTFAILIQSLNQNLFSARARELYRSSFKTPITGYNRIRSCLPESSTLPIRSLGLKDSPQLAQTSLFNFNKVYCTAKGRSAEAKSFVGFEFFEESKIPNRKRYQSQFVPNLYPSFVICFYSLSTDSTEVFLAERGDRVRGNSTITSLHICVVGTFDNFQQHYK